MAIISRRIIVVLVSLSLLASSASQQESPPCTSGVVVGDESFLPQSCVNFCESCTNYNETVGPAVLASGAASHRYDVAAFYFGHQN